MKDLIKVEGRDGDPIGVLDALTQIQNVRAALALIHCAAGDDFHFLFPCLLDKSNCLHWVALDEKSIVFFSTKYESKLAGAHASITLQRSAWHPINEKQVTDALIEIKTKSTEESFNTLYKIWAETMGLEMPKNPYELLLRVVQD